MTALKGSITGLLLAAASAGAAAHGGHQVTAGIPAEGHLHLASGVVVAGYWLPALLLAAAGVAAALLVRRASRRRSEGGRGRASPSG